MILSLFSGLTMSTMLVTNFSWGWAYFFVLIPALYEWIREDRSYTYKAYAIGVFFLINGIFSLSSLFFLKDWTSTVVMLTLGFFVLFITVVGYASSMFICIRYLNPTPMLIPFIWVLVENLLYWIHPTGYYLLSIGLGTIFTPILRQYASLGGMSLIAFILVMGNCLLLQLFRKWNLKWFIRTSIFFVMIISLGFYLLERNTASLGSVNVGMPFSNIPQKDRLTESMHPFIRWQYYHKTKAMLDKEPDVDIIFLPETITPSVNVNDKSFMDAMKDLALNSSIVFGTITYNEDKIYNSVLFLDDNKIQVFYKIYLVPFGEYWPYKKFFKVLFGGIGFGSIIPAADFSAGSHDQRSFFSSKKNGFYFQPAICLETLKPVAFRTAIDKFNSEMLYSASNLAWFFSSDVMREGYIIRSAFRAIENGRYLIMAINGVEGLIVTNKGEMFRNGKKIRHVGDLNVSLEKLGKDVKDTVLLFRHKTFYTRYGNWMLLFSFFVVLFLLLQKGLDEFFKFGF